MKTFLKSLFLLIVISFFSIEISAQTKLSVQGVIRLSDGNAIEDGLYPIEFKLYDTIVGGTLLWSEVQPQLKVTSGIYSTILGEVTPLDLQFNEFYFLSLTVEGEELLPRAPLTSAPYSNSVLGFDNVFPSTGNVGIGTLTPASELTIEGEIEISGSRIHVDSDGDVGIGTTNPKNGSFHINMSEIIFSDSIGNTPYLNFENSLNQSAQVGMVNNGDLFLMSYDNKVKLGTNNSFNMIVCDIDNQVGIMTASPYQTLSVNGSAGKTGGGSWETFSDRRLKKNIHPFSDGLGIVLQIDPVTFHYNGKEGFSSKEKYVGIIAQEMQKIAPFMVSEFTGQDGVSYLKYDPSALPYIIINAMQDQQEQIEKLTSENENLKKILSSQSKASNARLDALEEQLNEILQQQSVSKL